MEILEVKDLNRIIDDCKDCALKGLNPKKVFTTKLGKKLVFDGCVFDVYNDRIPSCDVYVEDNAIRNYLYCIDYLSVGSDKYQIKQTGSIEQVQAEINSNKYYY